MSASATVDLTTRCEACGLQVPAGAERCPGCGRSASSRSVRLPMAIIIAAILGVFAFTQYFVKLHRRTENELAQRWFHRGEQAMREQNPAGAADGFRTALSYDHDNDEYRLRLAEALLAANHLNEARAHLTLLWEQEPADGEINLALARLYAKRNASTEAVRYYRNAVNGVWTQDPVDQRQAAHFELVDYLLQRKDSRQAKAEAVALAADEPRDVADQLRLAGLLLQLGEPRRAIDVYKSTLESQRGNLPASVGLGKALLEAGDYREAERVLASAAEHAPAASEGRRELELSKELLRTSPSIEGLPFNERARRVAAAFDNSFRRFTNCAALRGYRLGDVAANGSQAAETSGQATAPNLLDLEQLYTRGLQLQPEATAQSLQRNPDALEPVMQYALQLEQATQPVCAETTVNDEALLFLAQHRNESAK